MEGITWGRNGERELWENINIIRDDGNVVKTGE